MTANGEGMILSERRNSTDGLRFQPNPELRMLGMEGLENGVRGLSTRTDVTGEEIDKTLEMLTLAAGYAYGFMKKVPAIYNTTTGLRYELSAGWRIEDFPDILQIGLTFESVEDLIEAGYHNPKHVRVISVNRTPPVVMITRPTQTDAKLMCTLGLSDLPDVTIEQRIDAVDHLAPIFMMFGNRLKPTFSVGVLVSPRVAMTAAFMDHAKPIFHLDDMSGISEV